MPVPWILLQLSDSALPTGGFVHSAGLESAFQQGELYNLFTLSGQSLNFQMD